MSHAIRDRSRPHVESLSEKISGGVDTAGTAIGLPRISPKERRILVIADSSTVTIRSKREMEDEEIVQWEKLHGLEGQAIGPDQPEGRPKRQKTKMGSMEYLRNKLRRRWESLQRIFGKQSIPAPATELPEPQEHPDAPGSELPLPSLEEPAAGSPPQGAQ